MPNERIYGWYESAEQPADQPTYNPALDSPCLFCTQPITSADVRTISLMAMPETGPARSYFYRVHRTCHEGATERQRNEIDSVVWDLIAINKD